MLYFTILYYTILYYTIRYYTILYYTILYYTILYYTTLYCTILYIVPRNVWTEVITNIILRYVRCIEARTVFTQCLDGAPASGPALESAGIGNSRPHEPRIPVCACVSKSKKIDKSDKQDRETAR